MKPPIYRPVFREIFLSQDKRIEVFFYTSNLPKFLHARTVFQRVGLLLGHFKSKSDPYSEDYSGSKEQLLARAIDEIRNSVGANSLFFVEDTSLKIEALSDTISDFPGLAVKEWFARTSFDELDSQLRKLNRGRDAVVHSCIALHVPKLSHPVYFEGYTQGTVAESPPTFEENVQYPWLTPNSFNGWFIPKDSNKRLGEMSFEESWGYDFRTKALVKLIDSLEEYQAILNLPSRAYSRALRTEASEQVPLFPASNKPVFVVVGHTCAGKTTFGDYASAKHGLRFMEASSIVRTFKSGLDNGSLDPFEFASKVLEEKGPDAVAIRIVQLYSKEYQPGLVITGFRTIEEVEYIKKHFPQCKIVWIEASERTRYERCLARGRDSLAKTPQEFRKLDSQQSKFGLLRVAKEFADIRIINEGDIKNYNKQIDAVITGDRINTFPGITTNIQPRYKAEQNQLYECLFVLGEAGRPLTCDEIQERTSARKHEIRHNNANKVLKRVPELAKRWEQEGSRVRYEILNPGRAYIRLMKEKASQEEAKISG
jgi:inosine/xanthosine triphosphate pyrophosphatase family protein/dephospho-CoA kinase